MKNDGVQRLYPSSMMNEIRKELSLLDDSDGPLRKFGMLFSVLFATGAGVLLWIDSLNWQVTAVASVLFFLAGLLLPSMLRKPFRLWMLLAFTLGWFITRLILLIAYAVVMTPMNVLLRLIGKDVLDEHIDKNKASYWKRHEPVTDGDRYKKQY